MSKGKKIAFITTMSGYPWGGSELLWSLTAEEALHQGWLVMASVFDWSLGHDMLRRIRDLGGIVEGRERIHKRSIFQRGLNRAKGFFRPNSYSHNSKWLRSISDFQPEIICVSQGNTYELFYDEALFLFLQRFDGQLIIVCQLNSDNHFLDHALRCKARQLFQKADTIAFVSDHNRQLAERQLGFKITKSLIFQNPVNIYERNCLPYPFQATAIFSNVARLDVKYKGQDILLEALGQLHWKNRDWQCRFYGEGPDKGYLEDLSRFYGIDKKVRFMGHVNDIQSIWTECHILLLPSRAEGTPLALLEALLSGRTAIATDVGGNKEWLGESVRGFLAEAPTLNSFGNALEKAWIAKDRWQMLGKEAHAYASKHLELSPAKKLFLQIEQHALRQ